MSPIYNHWKSSINSYVLFFLRKKTSYTDEEYFYRDFICNMRFLSFLNNLYSIFYNSFYLHFLFLFLLKHRCFQYGSIRADWCRNVGTYRPFLSRFSIVLGNISIGTFCPYSIRNLNPSRCGKHIEFSSLLLYISNTSSAIVSSRN